MKLKLLRISNFRSFGAKPTKIDLSNLTFLLGPNGAGKTAVLQALARMFSVDPLQRKVRRSDFHIPVDEKPDDNPDTRELWIEAEFHFPELAVRRRREENLPAVPGNLRHMQLITKDGPARVRFRLRATLDEDGDVEETFTSIIREDEEGKSTEESRVSKQDRNAIQVHYMPARRDPADQISYSANAILGRLLRAAEWNEAREKVGELTDEISQALQGNKAVEGLAESIGVQWSELHKGAYYANPSISFAQSEIENLLRHLSVGFTPGHDEVLVDFSRMSDGQHSLLYISLVLAAHDIGLKVLSGELDEAFDVDKLRPAIFTLVAVEEPENSLSPHYLGRVVKSMNKFAVGKNAQALIATHAAALLRRVPPENVRYLRLSRKRTTLVKTVELPEDETAQKFIREGVQAFPELYFSRLVVLGEGDSEEIVLPRLLEARGTLADDASISFAPLGGRHVNHMWRLLHGLGIPHVTLLDLDVARYQGGWGRVKYAAKQLLEYSDSVKSDVTQEEIDDIPDWDAEHGIMVDDSGWIARLEKHGVFFSTPLDLDFMMLMHYRDEYEVADDELEKPEETAIKSVLGKKHDTLENQYSAKEQTYFDAYHQRFKLGSKPTWHVRAMAESDDAGLVDGLPKVLGRLFDYVEARLKVLPE